MLVEGVEERERDYNLGSHCHIFTVASHMSPVHQQVWDRSETRFVASRGKIECLDTVSHCVPRHCQSLCT